ncbi:lipid A 1-diphosphate synthase [Bisbaumannia pacifica]|uniref:Lipid A 1-diphosphate synthase n=1 Tax=Bisbaumannia pacifica TaxID=77098 RepID=A0A510X6U7_9GAMM|nr:phosphatase PAP2 family protein [Halomonas pacifica]GEK46711.1 lipid A 1-diphosphate synthase [Halomonas pacifica]
MLTQHPDFAPARLLFYNLLGIALILGWWSPNLLIWEALDDAVFFTTNAWLHGDNMAWVHLVALANHRAFDGISLLAMAAVLLWAIRRDPVGEHRWLRWGGIGLTLLLTAGIVNRIEAYVVTYRHASPTLVYDNATRVTELVDYATKAVSASSFPSDHGLMLMIFAAFMWRFAGPRVGLMSAALVVLFSAPRILGGAHWFSDIYFGSLAIALVLLPWALCTPLAPRTASAITRGLIVLEARLLPARAR